MLVVPYAFDQPDNAARVKRLGVARVMSRKDYKAQRLTEEIDRLRSDTSYSAAARDVGRLIVDENGVRSACDAIEDQFLHERSSSAT